MHSPQLFVFSQSSKSWICCIHLASFRMLSSVSSHWMCNFSQLHNDGFLLLWVWILIHNRHTCKSTTSKLDINFSWILSQPFTFCSLGKKNSWGKLHKCIHLCNAYRPFMFFHAQMNMSGLMSLCSVTVWISCTSLPQLNSKLSLVFSIFPCLHPTSPLSSSPQWVVCLLHHNSYHYCQSKGMDQGDSSCHM